MAIIGFIVVFIVLLYVLCVSLVMSYVSMCFGSKVSVVSLSIVLLDLYFFYLLFQHSPFNITML